MRTRVIIVSLTMVLIGAAVAWASVGMVTEVKPVDGVAEVKPTGSTTWKRLAPLQALKEGDVIRTSRKASVVVMYANSKESATITAAVSPYTVKSLRKKNGQDGKAQELLNEVAGFLTNKKRTSLSSPLAARESLSMPLAVRGGGVPSLWKETVILAPAMSQVMDGRPTIEWSGQPRTTYDVRILDGDRVVWERTKLTKTRLAYPAEEAPLAEGKRYTIEVRSSLASPSTTWVQVATPSERAAIQESLTLLEKSMAPELPAASRTALTFGVLASKGYWAAAREKVIAGIAADADDPTLHMLLGDYYTHIGSQQLASEEYDEADFLLEVKR